MAWGQSLPAPIAINPSLPPHTQRQAETYSLEVRFNVIKLTPHPHPRMSAVISRSQMGSTRDCVVSRALPSITASTSSEKL